MRSAQPVMMPPLDGPAVQRLEEALLNSATKTIHLRITQLEYRLSREGRWFKLAELSKKKTEKRAAIFETMTELYNLAVHGQEWQICAPRSS